MPAVATSPTDLLALLADCAHLDGERLVIDDEAGFRDAGIRDLAWTAAFSTDEATIASAQWLVWEASQELGARSASIQALYDARARGEVSGFTVPAINLRAQTFDMARTVFEAAEAADVGAVILELARSEQTYTFQRPVDYATSVLAGRRRRRLARPRLHPGRPLPVQRQEVRRRPGGHDRGDPARLPAGDRRRLSQHRHRLVDPRRPVEAERRRGAARELPSRGRADRAHPDARDRRRDGQRRRRDRRGRDAELDGRRVARVPRRVPARARRARARRAAASPRSASRPGPRTVASRCPTVAWPRSSSTSRSSASSASSRASTAWPVPSSTAPRPCPTSCSIASRQSRPPRSTSRPASRTRSTSTRPSRPSSTARSRPGASRNAADERKTDQTDQQFVYTTRKKAIGPFKRQLWDLPTEGRDPGRPASQDLVPVHRAGQRVERHPRRRPVERHRPRPTSWETVPPSRPASPGPAPRARAARRRHGHETERLTRPMIRGAILPRRSAGEAS